MELLCKGILNKEDISFLVIIQVILEVRGEQEVVIGALTDILWELFNSSDDLPLDKAWFSCLYSLRQEDPLIKKSF
jgi:hypothetical protein